MSCISQLYVDCFGIIEIIFFRLFFSFELSFKVPIASSVMLMFAKF